MSWAETDILAMALYTNKIKRNSPHVSQIHYQNHTNPSAGGKFVKKVWSIWIIIKNEIQKQKTVLQIVALISYLRYIIYFANSC
jgi:hypothetical protein